METDKLNAILAEFFRDSFSEDAAGVADWLSQSEHDVDEFIAALNAAYPQE